MKKMLKKMMSLALVLMTVFALMLPVYAGAEVKNTTTTALDDGMTLVYTEHLLQPDDPKIGRVSVQYYNGTKYVEEYKLLEYEEWVDEDNCIHCKNNVERVERIYMCTGMLICVYQF